MQESVGRNRSTMNLLTKLMTNFKRHVSAGCGVSKNYYRGEKERLAGTEQDSKSLEDMYQDVSYLIIPQIEKQLIGVFFADENARETLYYAAVAFADDMDLITKGAEALKVMSKILDMRNKLHRAIGGCAQEAKTRYFVWQWK